MLKLIYHCIVHLTWPIPKTDPSDGDKLIKCKCGKVLYYKVTLPRERGHFPPEVDCQ